MDRYSVRTIIKWDNMPHFNMRPIDLLKKYNFHLDRNIITYLICVVIATILWFFNALNKDYTTEISYPVKYTNFPQGKYLISKLPTNISLEVRAKGFSLLGHKIRTSFLPITFNVNTYSHHLLEKDNVFEYVLNTNDIKEKISDQLSNDIKLQNIAPETITFKFALSVNKKVAVQPVIDYTLKRQYILNHIITIPDSIEISGPSTIMDTLKRIRTYPIVIKELGKDISIDASLEEIPGCTFSTQEVKVELEVEQFTEARKTIRLLERNVPKNITLRLFPDYVTITYDVGLSRYEKIKDSDFKFTVDYKQTFQSSYLEVKAEKLPSFIKNLSYTPHKIEYIIEKK